MMILPEQLTLGSTAAAQAPSTPTAGTQPKASPTVTVANKEVSSAVTSPVPTLGSAQRDVTFRRDPNGRVYYVVSDAQSGTEIREVPAETIRKIGESIDEYLKQEEAKVTSHVNVKA